MDVSSCGHDAVLDGRTIYHVTVSLFPNWMGSPQERFYELAGDRLHRRTGPMLLRESEPRAHLIWQWASAP